VTKTGLRLAGRSLGVAAVLLVTLSACGGGASTDATTAPPPASSTPPTPAAPAATPTHPTDVVTFKNDLGRTGQNLTETVITPANVNSSTFGLLRTLMVDGKVDAQPLYLSGLIIGSAPHNAAFVATESDSVYAFDADTGGILWHASLLRAGETLSDQHGCYQIQPNIGITSTPVIDRSAGAHGAIYVVAMSKDPSGAYHQRLHALDLTNGTELFNGPVDINATYSVAGLTTSFDPGQYAERAALLLSNGVVYTSWTSHCDFPPYSGWIIGYDQHTLAQTGVLDIGPNSNAGPSIWMSGDGPAADSAGNIYLLSANGAFESSLDANGFPSGQDYGNSFLKLSISGARLGVADYFALSNAIAESKTDTDLGSGGEMLLPDLTDSNGTVRHLMVGAGKNGTLYVVNRDSMGKFNANSNNIWQELTGVLPGGVWGSPAYLNGTVYYADLNGSLKAFTITNAKLGNIPASQTMTQFPSPGTSPVVSANGTANGIVWAHENSPVAVLHAYDASNLAHELYNSNQAGNRDHFGTGNKFIVPTIADGKVFVGTQNSVGVFGLLH
jgi:PQQ-like domain